MHNHTLEARSENFWSFVLSTLFVAIVVVGIYFLNEWKLDFSNQMSVPEVIIIMLAAFRMTRLVVYDKIFVFFRDFFTTKTKKWNKKEGFLEVTREKPKKGLRRKIYELLACPWCAGVWISMGLVFLYLFLPISWPFFLILAVAGVSSFIQIMINKIGWQAEGRKLEVQKMHK